MLTSSTFQKTLFLSSSFVESLFSSLQKPGSSIAWEGAEQSASCVPAVKQEAKLLNLIILSCILLLFWAIFAFCTVVRMLGKHCISACNVSLQIRTYSILVLSEITSTHCASSMPIPSTNHITEPSFPIGDWPVSRRCNLILAKLGAVEINEILNMQPQIL